MKKANITIFFSLLFSGLILAAGFNLGEFGGRSAAMGNAAVAQGYDPSTIYYNPAGIGFLEGTQFYGGVTLIAPQGTFVGADPIFPDREYEQEDQIFPPLGIYATHRFNEKFAAGIGLTTPFGLGVAWEDEDFPGRFISKDVTLASYYISPVVAYKPHPKLSISGGADFVISSLELNRNVLLFSSEGSPGTEVGTATLEGTTELAVGFTASAMYRTDRLGVGVAYRHSVNNEADDGDATFNVFDDLDAKTKAFANALLKDQKVATGLEYPSILAAGLYYKLTESLGAEVSYAYFGWDVFDELVLDFDDDRLNQTIPENYENSSQLRVGVHYEATDRLSLRGGFIWDETPQPIESVSPLLPDDTRNDYTFGIGYDFGKFKLDGGYMFVDIGDRTTVENGVGKHSEGFDGTYNSQAHLYYLSLGYTIQ